MGLIFLALAHLRGCEMYEFLQHEIQFFIFCLTTLFTLINPIGISPILIIMTERFPQKEKINIAKKGSLTAFITLILFSLLGSVIFNFFGITIEAFQIMGGVLFFRNGLRMLDSKIGRSRTTPAEQEESEESDDIAVSPIGIPLIAGPGAITAAMLLSSQTPQIYSYFTLIFSIFFVLSLVYLILRNGNVILKLLGTTGIRVIQRLMGLILMVIAVQFVINGVISIYKPLVV
jgi:multiple antibiotic resistance protein